jgi:hypothetical protein
MQMKQIINLIIFTALLTACNQPKSKKQNDNIAESAKTTKTVNHVKIPNSHLYIIPPAGFAADELSASLAQTEGTAHFMQMRIIRGHTQDGLFTMMKTEAEKSFPGSWKEEAVTFNGHKATIYHSKTAAYSQYYFAFTDGYTDEMIIANYEEKDAATGKAMYEALKTVVVGK